MEPDSLWARLQEAFFEALPAASGRLDALLPQIVLAVAVLLAGVLLAALVHLLVVRLLDLVALDKLIAKTPLEAGRKRLGWKQPISRLLASLLFWLVILLALVLVADVLKLTPVAHVLGVVAAYLPQVIAALLVVVLGVLLAKFLQTLTVQALATFPEQTARLAGRTVHVVVLVFAVLAAVEQLGLRTTLLTTNVTMVLAAFLVVVGLGLVIGARQFLENAVSNYRLQQELAEGQFIEIGEHSGTITRFTTTHVILQEGSSEVVLPASVLATHTYKRSTSS